MRTALKTKTIEEVPSVDPYNPEVTQIFRISTLHLYFTTDGYINAVTTEKCSTLSGGGISILSQLIYLHGVATVRDF